MRGLQARGAAAGIPLPRVRAFDLDADRPWAIFDALPGVPVVEAGESAPGGGASGVRHHLERVPALFGGGRGVLPHGAFSPVNVLTDGAAVTGLLDFEAVRLADPLFDAAWP